MTLGTLVAEYPDDTDSAACEWLRFLADHIPGLLWSTDCHLRFTSSLGAGLTDLGLKPNQIVGRTLREYAGEGVDADLMVDSVSRALSGDRVAFQVVDSQRQYEAHVAPLRNSDGVITGTIGIALDVTARRAAEEAVRASEERFRTLAEEAPVGIFQTDLAGSCVYANRFARALAGLDADELRDRCWGDFVHPDDRDRVLGEVAEADFDGRPFSGEFRFTSRSGGSRWGHHRTAFLRDANGILCGRVVLVMDVTDRKAAEEQVRRQATLLDEAPDPIYAWDLTKGITYWNASAAELYGWSAREATGKDPRELIGPHAPAAPEGFEDAICSDGRWRGEMQQKTRSGRPIVVESNWTLLREEAGKPSALLVIGKDVTERRENEARQRRAQRMESIGAVAGGIAHDLNNMLASVQLANDLLEVALVDHPARELLGVIREVAMRGTDLVRQMLIFARGESGQEKQQPEDLPVVTMSAALAGTLEMLRRAFPPSITWEVDLPTTLWPVRADATQLSQVVMNLCVNARDAMPRDGHLTIFGCNRELSAATAAEHPGAHAGRYVVVSVSDDGTGMSPEVRSRIFDEFFTTKEIGKGTGLGLSMVQRIVQGHRGFVDLDTAIGRGTHFRIWLPAADRGPAPRPSKKIPAARRGDGRLILAVDDEPMMRQMICATLAAGGYRTASAADGAGAVAEFAKHEGEIAVAVTDLMMPVMDGTATARALRSIAPRLPVLMISGFFNGSAPAKDPRDAQLGKPFTAEELLRSVERLAAGSAN